jgi:hypothetical protein
MRNRSRNLADVNQIAKSIVHQSIGAVPKILPPVKDPAAVALGRKGGLKGGKARRRSSARRS